MRILLTASSLGTGKPGRPPEIADEQLRRNRNDLLFALEESWAFVGWELQQAQSPQEIRAALRRIQGINCSRLEPFRLEYRRATSFSQLQAKRKQLRNLSGKLREMQSNREKHKESFGHAQSALKMNNHPENRTELQGLFEEIEAAFTTADNALNQTRTRWTLLDIAVLHREAAFAQLELLNFIASERYASTPLTFANAMAGLPIIHWRQSMDRCRKFRDRVPHGFTYRLFQIVANVFEHPAANADETVERMNARIRMAKGKDVKTCNSLAENWYFLRSAIEHAFEAGRHPKEALPFLVFAEYLRRSRTQSPLDTLLAGKEKITMPVYVKDPRKASFRCQ